MPGQRGVFVAFEGLDGSGKSTQIRLLTNKLKENGYDPFVTAEPTGTNIGMILRDSIRDSRSRIPLVTEALLFAADRFEHVKNHIEPAVSAGKIVLSDRYLHSSIAYQGAQGLDRRWIKIVNRYASEADLSIYLDVTPEVGLERMKSRQKTVFEVVSLQTKIREIYLELVNQGVLVLVDANRSILEVQNDIFKLILELLEKRKSMPNP